MKHAKFIGNFSNIVNCEKILNQVKQKDGHKKTGKSPYGKNTILTQELESGIDEFFSRWKKAGYYDGDSVEWINFYPDQDFDKTLLEILFDTIGVTPKNIWISSIQPGKCVPWHWDIETKSKEWENEGTLVRYSLFLDQPEIGQIFILQNDCFHMCDQGSVYKWNLWNDYHIGVNVGFSQKYMLHIVGVEK
jgi:hypothetical protein